MYDPTIGRWSSIDPIIEAHFDYTPYAYVYNNPINYIDLFGLDSIPVNEVDWPNFDIENDEILFDEIVVTPPNNDNDNGSGNDNGKDDSGDKPDDGTIFPEDPNDPLIDIELTLKFGLEMTEKTKIFNIGSELTKSLITVEWMTWNLNTSTGFHYTPYRSISSSFSYGGNFYSVGASYDYLNKKFNPNFKLGALSKGLQDPWRLTILDIGHMFGVGYNLKVTASPVKIINQVSKDAVERANRIGKGDYSMWGYPRWGGRIF